jgi:hypothetical protein
MLLLLSMRTNGGRERERERRQRVEMGREVMALARPQVCRFS